MTKNLEGQTINNIKVLYFYDLTKNRHKRYVCECYCFNKTKFIVLGTNLVEGNTKSCGCILDEYREARKAAAKTDSPLYMTWIGMRRRCRDTRDSNYMDWGGRGIKICDEWFNSEVGFQTFEKWAIENGWQPGLSINRINNATGNYYPDECDWQTAKVQAQNRRSNHIVNPWNKGEMCLEAAVEKYAVKGVNSSMVRKRLKRGWAIERALIEKPKGNGGVIRDV